MTGGKLPPSAGACVGLCGGVRRLLLLAAVIGIAIPSAAVSEGSSSALPDVARVPASAGIGARSANFGKEPVSPDARHVADWVADSGDNAGVDFLIVDKKFARVYAFDANAHVRGSSAVLLGAAKGDNTVPGIGSRRIADVRPHERTTPAGRFVGERGYNSRGENVVWVDYDAAVSMHRVVTTNPKERRLQRLATSALDDKRISYGCINVPVAFFEAYIVPVFAEHRAIIYVLPEVSPVEHIFGTRRLAATSGIARHERPDFIEPQRERASALR